MPQQSVTTVSMVAGADLSAKQYYIVKADSTEGQVVLASAATDVPFGVLLNKPVTNEAAEVAIDGIVPIVSNGSSTTVSIGDFVGTDASGKAVKKATDADYIVGVALQQSTTNGAQIETLLRLGQRAS